MEENQSMPNLKIKYKYPSSSEFEYEAKLERINLDKESEHDILSGNGFVISASKAINKQKKNAITHQEIKTLNFKKDLKDPNGIFSTRYGQTLQDVNPYEDRYKCECGNLKSRVHHGLTCPICNTKVKYVDDNFGYFGWMCLKDPYFIIHPNLFKSIEFLIGRKKVSHIITPIDEKDGDGNSIETSRPSDEPFYGIGIMELKERFDEIIEYYSIKNKNKYDVYLDIVKNRKNVFIQSIPVYSALLRPFKLDDGNFSFEGTNATYNMMVKLVSHINKDDIEILRKSKTKKQLLYDLQIKYNELYETLNKNLVGKNGNFRKLFGGRMNFTARNVITPDPTLRIDQIKLPYVGLIELLQQRIINILQKSYNISYAHAYIIWYKASIQKDKMVYNIIEGIIRNSYHGKGLPVIINRNPTINYGGLIQMFCIGINDSYNLSMPLQVLKGLGADFDGDTLNILLPINEDFINAAFRVFNPANSMYISRNNGLFDNAYNHQRDTIININTLMYLSRDNYSKEQIQQIINLKNNQ